MKIIFISVSLLAVILFGCAPPPSKIAPEETLTFEEISASLRESANSFETFSAEGSITVESPQLSQAVGFELASRGNDSMKIIVQGPFGITVGMALFTKNNFTAYNAINNSLYRGSLTAQSKFPLLASLSPSIAFNALQGLFVFAPEQSADSFSVSQDGIFSFVILTGEKTYDSYFYNPNYKRIVRYVRKQLETNETMWNISYQFTKKENGAIMPEIITLTIPKEQTTLTIEYESALFNKEIANLKISFPNDAEVITVQ